MNNEFYYFKFPFVTGGGYTDNVILLWFFDVSFWDWNILLISLFLISWHNVYGLTKLNNKYKKIINLLWKNYVILLPRRVIMLLDSLFNKKQARQFDSIAKKKAKLHTKEISAVVDFMSCNSMETIVMVLDIVDANGHPKEKALSRELRNKYTSHELEFDDIITLEALYKSNYQYFKNKDEDDE